MTVDISIGEEPARPRRGVVSRKTKKRRRKGNGDEPDQETLIDLRTDLRKTGFAIRGPNDNPAKTRAEKTREKVHGVLRRYESANRPLPAHPSRPAVAWLNRIAEEAGVARYTISYLDHPNRKLLDQFVSKLGLEIQGGAVGSNFENSDHITGKIESYLNRLSAEGRKLPRKKNGVCFKAVAREAGVCVSTLKIPGHKNRILVEKAVEKLGLETRRSTRKGPLLLIELRDILIDGLQSRLH